MKNNLLAGVVVFGLAATPLFAQLPQPVQQHNTNAIWFENWIGLSNTTMKISTPSGEIVTIFAESGTPVFQLSGRDILDGVYRYEISAATEERQKIVNQVDNGRGDNARDEVTVPYHMSGYFLVERGVIVEPQDIKEES